MKVGKLPNSVLKNEILSKLNINNNDVLMGPGIGEDCAVVNFNGEKCVLTTDPITAACNHSGTLAVHISCNDIASAGVSPLGVMVTLLAPPSCEIEDIKEIMDDVSNACRELNICVLGGHTEVTEAVNRIIISVTAIGKGEKIVTTKGSNIGDDIVVTGFAGLEGTVILASDYKEHLLNYIEEEKINKIGEMLKSISVVKVGVLSNEFGVSAMHDATEGGILGAIWEIAESSDLGAYIYENKIPIKNETIELSKIFNIDPYKLISSGSMIITTKHGEDLVKILNSNGINACVVGKITDKNVIINKDGIEEVVSPPEADEIYKVSI